MLNNQTTNMTALHKVEPSPPGHDDVLKVILSKVKRVDFSDHVGGDTKPSNPQYHVICINELFKQVPDKFGLAWDNQAIVYNGCFWQSVEKKEMENFLFNCAVKMGVPWLAQSHYKQKDALLKQFASASPAPKTNNQIMINLINGTLLFSPEPELKPFNKHDYLRYQLNFEYDTSQTAPVFQKYLDRCLPDKSAQMLLAEYLGYLFIPHADLKLEKALILYGSGANGKSVMFDIVNALLGRQNVANYSLESLCDDKGYHRAGIENKLLNFCTEISGKRIESSFFKAMVSGEPVEARLPYQEPVLIERYAKMMFNTNELPATTDMTEGFFRRFLIIPFDVVIPPTERDSTLAQKIIANELSGVLNWIIDGLNRLLSNRRFTECEAVRKAVKQYRHDADTVLSFLDDGGIKPGAVELKGSTLYLEYKNHCQDCGRPALGRSKFFIRLVHSGFERTEKRKQAHFGIDKIIDPANPVGFDPEELPY